MSERERHDLTRQFVEATALAAEYHQPAYVLAPEEEGAGVAVALLWPEVLTDFLPRVEAIILPDGIVFVRREHAE